MDTSPAPRPGNGDRTSGRRRFLQTAAFGVPMSLPWIAGGAEPGRPRLPCPPVRSVNRPAICRCKRMPT